MKRRSNKLVNKSLEEREQRRAAGVRFHHVTSHYFVAKQLLEASNYHTSNAPIETTCIFWIWFNRSLWSFTNIINNHYKISTWHNIIIWGKNSDVVSTLSNVSGVGLLNLWRFHLIEHKNTWKHRNETINIGAASHLNPDLCRKLYVCQKILCPSVMSSLRMSQVNQGRWL